MERHQDKFLCTFKYRWRINILVSLNHNYEPLKKSREYRHAVVLFCARKYGYNIADRSQIFHTERIFLEILNVHIPYADQPEAKNLRWSRQVISACFLGAVL